MDFGSTERSPLRQAAEAPEGREMRARAAFRSHFELPSETALLRLGSVLGRAGSFQTRCSTVLSLAKKPSSAAVGHANRLRQMPLSMGRMAPFASFCWMARFG